MRRLTLILSDLYLPEEAERGVIPAALDLPSLDWLLRFANRSERISDWRSWLSADLGASRLAKLPVAQCCALGLLPPDAASSAASSAWLATPVHLEARLDHVRLADRGLLHIGAQERMGWCEEFAQVFGPQYALHDAGDHAFLLTGAAQAITASVDPARLLDADIGHALPSGPAAGELRRLATEIEMWLHGARLNVARVAHERRVSALWLWGGGAGDARLALGEEGNALNVLHIHGRDPYLLALARLARQFGCVVQPLKPAPPSFDALMDIPARAVIELAPMSGPASESLAGLEGNWFTPIRAALSAGSLERVDLLANDRWFGIAARPAWRIWRRRIPWLAQLALKA